MPPLPLPPLSNEESDLVSGNTELETSWVIVLIVMCTLLFCCCSLWLLCCSRRRRNDDKESDEEKETTELKVRTNSRKTIMNFNISSVWKPKPPVAKYQSTTSRQGDVTQLSSSTIQEEESIMRPDMSAAMPSWLEEAAAKLDATAVDPKKEYV